MNRSYIPEARYNTAYIPSKETVETPRAVEAILVFFDLLLGFFASSAVRATMRVFGSVFCFFAFLFVIGAVEAGTLSFGAGVLSSLLLFAVAFFCVYRPWLKKN